MALSDYLTDREWDASYYVFLNPHKDFEAPNLGAAMHSFIDRMIKKDYKFEGLDESGDKKEQLSSNNGDKFVKVAFGDMTQEMFLEIVQSGRNFLKEHNTDLVFETDEEWKEQIDAVKQP